MSTIKPRIRPTPWHLATPLMPIEPVPGMEWECRVIGRIAIGYGASPREAYERWATLHAASMARQDEESVRDYLARIQAAMVSVREINPS